MSPTYYTSDSLCRRCNGVQRYRSPPALKGKCASCVSCAEAERETKNWVSRTRETLTPDDDDPSDEMLVEGWDE